MISVVVAATLGLALWGIPGAILAALPTWGFRVVRARLRSDPPPPRRLLLVLLAVQLRGGASVLSALQGVSAVLPHPELKKLARLATVTGLRAAVESAPPEYVTILGHLARAQRSGASLGVTVRRLLEQDLTADRSLRLARSRSLPARLMIPMTLLMLPGTVLMLYAPSLLSIFDELSGVLQ